MDQRRRGLPIQYLPPPSPNIEGDCGPYPRHELLAARRALILQLQYHNPALNYIKPKLGILPDNRRVVYLGRRNCQAGGFHNHSWSSTTNESVYNGPQNMNSLFGPPGRTPETSSGDTRNCEATEDEEVHCEQPQAQNMKDESKKKSTKPTKQEVFFKCDMCGVANSSSGEMSKHLEESNHLTASEYQGEIKPRFVALQLLRPMTSTCRSKDFGSIVPACKACGMRFDNIFSCLGHMLVSHKMQNLSYHVRQVTETNTEVINNDGTRPVCKVCQVKTNSLSDLIMHCNEKCHFLHDLPQIGADVYFACKTESCQKKFFDAAHLMNHLNQHRSDIPEYSFVWARLGDFSELRLLDADVDSESRVDLESVLCSHLALFYEKSSYPGRDSKHKNLEKYQQLLEEKKKDIEHQKKMRG